MPSGKIIPMSEVREKLEAVMGRALLTKAVDYVNHSMIADMAPIQMEEGLSKLLSAKHAVYVNAIAKLALWESKLTARDEEAV